MQIEKVTLNQSEVDTIFNKCIELFDPQVAASHAQGHEINFSLNEDLEIWATLDLNVEYGEFDSNHQTSPVYVTAKLKLDMYHFGQSVEGLEKTNLEDRIKDYNWIKYF